MVTPLVALVGLWAQGLAQEPAKDTAKGPNDDKFKEYELSLEQIHSRAGRNVWNPHQATFWSERQCRSCHAAPGGTAGRINELFLNTGTVANGLGIEVAPLDGTLRAHLNMDEKSGLVITSAPEQSEGAKGGLKHHDVLLSINEQGVNDPAKFNELLGGLQGKKARFGLLRQGKPLALEVAVPQTPLAWAINLGLERIAWSDDRYRIGVTLSEADDTLRSHLKLAAGEGLVVTEVVDDSPTAKMGVKLHDVLIELDGKRLTSVEAINGQIQEIKEKTVLLKLLRSGQEVTCQIAPKKSSEPVEGIWKETVLVDAQARHPAVVRWFDMKNGKAVEAGEVLSSLGPASDAAAQLAELKKQLAELGKTVERLEAVISPPAPPAEEKKPEGSPEKK
jgi:membrane-associated protease RseP (regulator of RpoE activity)